MFTLIWLLVSILTCIYAINTKKIDHAATLLSNFKQWFLTNGGKLDNSIDITSFPGMGNGFIAMTSINEGKRILSIPHKLIFSLSNMKQSKDHDIQLIYKHLATSDHDLAIITWLLLEYKKQKESFFYPYIEILPSYISSLLYYNTSELAQLQSSSFQQSIIQYQQEIQHHYQLLYQLMHAIPSTMVKTLLSTVTYEEYQWATTIVNSRGLRFHGEIYVAPMADLFNYQAHSILRSANSGEFFLKHHQLNSQSHDLVILADRDVKSLDQLYEDYGDNTNEIYFQYHGFIPDQNPFQCISFDTAALLTLNTEKEEETEERKAFLTLKQSLLTKLRFRTPPVYCLNTQVQSIQRPLIIYLTVLSYTKQEYTQCHQYVKKEPIDWSTVYRQCSFEKIVNQIEQELRSQSTMSATGDVEEGSKPSIQGSKTSELLIERVWYQLQQLIELKVTSNDYQQTTLEEDEEQLEKMHEQLTSFFAKKNTVTTEEEEEDDEEEEKTVEDNSWKGYLHHEYAIKYRIANKQILYDLCILFQIDEQTCQTLQTRKSTETAEGQGQENGDITLEEKIIQFNQWFQSYTPEISLIEAAVIPGYRIGTIVTAEKIHVDDIYLTVPIEVIMSHEIAFDNPSIHVSTLLHSLASQYKTRDSLHELLFFLLSEHFLVGSNSMYAPYLQLLPSYDDMKSYVPIFWTSSDIQEYLFPSFLIYDLLTNQQKHQRRYVMLSNNTEIMNYFGQEIFTFEHYLWAMSVLDSRSIWWKSTRHLVPMLDFINCQEQIYTNPSRVHSTTLDELELNAITRAGDEYQQGDQLFENYGQPNHIYFTYHGFILPSNTHDCIQYGLQLTPDEYRSISQNNKYAGFLTRLGVHSPDSYFMTCLASDHIPSSTWVFLKLKMNQVPNQDQRNTIDQPTFTTVQYLMKHIEQRLILYVANRKHQDDVPMKFKVAVELVHREQIILQRVIEYLQNIAKHLEESAPTANHDQKSPSKNQKSAAKSNSKKNGKDDL